MSWIESRNLFYESLSTQYLYPKRDKFNHTSILVDLFIVHIVDYLSLVSFVNHDL